MTHAYSETKPFYKYITLTWEANRERDENAILIPKFSNQGIHYIASPHPTLYEDNYVLFDIFFSPLLADEQNFVEDCLVRIIHYIANCVTNYIIYANYVVNFLLCLTSYS